MEEFQKYLSRPFFTVIFRPEMLKYHPYSILTGETMVGFVIYRVLRTHKPQLTFLTHNISDIGGKFMIAKLIENLIFF